MRMGANSIHAVGSPQRIVLRDCWPSPVVGLEVDSCQRALLLLSVGLPVANTPDVLQPCGLLYYP